MRRLTREEKDAGFHVVSPKMGTAVAEIDRFRSYVPDIETAGTEGCWMWTGKKTGAGYPVFWDGNIQEWTTAARWAYDTLRSPVDPTQRVTRACGKRGCVNPFHARILPR